MTPDETYWAACREGKFSLQQCKTCGSWQFPPTTLCSTCLSTDLSWRTPSGRGVVWSWIRMHKAYFASFTSPTPYLVAMIELEERVRMVSTVAGVGDAISLDTPVEVAFPPATDAAVRRAPVFVVRNACAVPT